MLYVLHGDDAAAVSEKLTGLVASLRKKKPDAPVISASDAEFTESALTEYLYGSGLFSARSIVVMPRVLDDVTTRKLFMEHVRDIADSGNVFVVTAGDLDARTLKTFEKHAEKMQRCGAPREARDAEFNMFSLADALGKRNRQELWVGLMRARGRALSAEEVHGMLFWQAKAMQLAAASNSPEEAGLKPFPYRKARGFARNYTSGELRTLSRRLVAIYHDARRGEHELDVALERFALTL